MINDFTMHLITSKWLRIQKMQTEEKNNETKRSKRKKKLFLEYMEAQILKICLLGANPGGAFVGSMCVLVCSKKLWIRHWQVSKSSSVVSFAIIGGITRKFIHSMRMWNWGLGVILHFLTFSLPPSSM